MGGGQFWTPITPNRGSIFHADQHLDYHIEFDHAFYSVPHALIGRRVRARLTHKTVEIFHNTNVSPAMSESAGEEATSPFRRTCPRTTGIMPTGRRKD